MRRSHLIYLGSILICLAAATVFLLRGPTRGLRDSHDFGTVYTASRVWLQGHNPYDHSVLTAEWLRAGGAPEHAPSRVLTPSVYPPTAFITTAPLALLPWPAARVVWCATNLLILVLLVEGLRRLAGFDLKDHRTVLLLAVTLALRPVSSAFELGQTSLLATALGVWALLAVNKNRQGIAGFAHSVALAAKATVAAAFVLPDLAAHRWRSVLVTAGVLIAFGAMSVLRMDDPVACAGNWRENLHTATAVGGVNDPSTANPSRHQLINLQYPLSTLIRNPSMVNVVTWTLVTVLTVPAAISLLRRPSGAALLLPVGMMAIAQCLAVYHRIYDATVLVFPLAWALLPSTAGWQRWPTLGLLFLFVVPGTSPPSTAAPDAWLSNPLRNWILVPREAWAMLLLLVWASWCQCASLVRPATFVRSENDPIAAFPAKAGSESAFPLKRVSMTTRQPQASAAP